MNGKKWTNSDEIFLINNYEKYGLKYVSEELNRNNSFIAKKAMNLGITSQQNNPFVEKELLIEKMKISHTYKELLQNLNKVVNGINLKLLKKYIIEYNISEDLMVFKIDRTNRKRKNINEWLQNGTTIGSSKLKEKLYKEGLKKRMCEKCGQDETWNGERMSLILDHINGINDDNRIENLRIVCPNCNATLPTHCRGQKRLNEKILKDKQKSNKKILKDSIKQKYKKDVIDNIKKRHLKQRKVERPSYEQLINEINELGYCGTGRIYGVSDNAIRKWKKFYENEK